MHIVNDKSEEILIRNIAKFAYRNSGRDKSGVKLLLCQESVSGILPTKVLLPAST